MSRHMECAIALLILLAVAVPTAQSQDLLWSNNYGGQYNEFGRACQQADNGDFFVLGSTYSYGNGQFDMYLVKTDSLGHRISDYTFGGEMSEYGYDLHRTGDGGFILVGSTKSYGAGERDVYLVKVDADGEMLWSKTFGGVADDEARSVRQTSDGGFIICGGTYSFGAGYQDVYLIKTDSYGNLVWQQTFGGAGGESGAAVRQTPDGGYIVIGSTGSFGEGYSSIYVVRTNQDGDSLWAATYGGSRADYGYALECTMDGGVILAGATASYGAGSLDAYLVKIDPYGNQQWQGTYGGADEDRAYSVTQTPSGNFLLAGNTLSFSSTFDIYLVKTNPIGTALWTRQYGGPESDYCESVLKDMHNNVVLTGRSYSYSSGGSDVYVVRLQGDQMTDVFDPVAGSLPSGYQLAQNYPNPFNMTTVIEFSLTRRSDATLTIYNVLGQRVKQWSSTLPAGTYRFEWDGRSESGHEIASGMYFYNLKTETFNQTKKMVLLK